MRIVNLFKFCDVDESGDISYSEFRDGLRKLPYDPQIHISSEDWDIFYRIWRQRPTRHEEDGGAVYHRGSATRTMTEAASWRGRRRHTIREKSIWFITIE